ncbi:MAG: hypothetical protein ACXWMG_04305 [Candidatus Limnocylindria bacterium]
MTSSAATDTWARTVLGLTKLVERITPWLLDLGNLIFGALIAFNLLILAALLTVGPVDMAVLVSTAAIALALPPDVAGFGLLRLAADMKRVDLERVATQAFVEAGFQVGWAGRVASRDEAEQRRARVVLRYSYVLLALSVLLTFSGVTAALWHMAWWIGVVFVGASAISMAVFFVALTATGAESTWSTPAGETESDGE